VRIALLSTVYRSTPPVGYGGIERVVYHLAEELVRRGHAVTLFGPPGSACSGRTITVSGYDPATAPSSIPHPAAGLSEERLYEALQEFLRKERVDVVHDWTFQNLFVLRHRERVPFLISTCVPPHPGYARPNLVACSQAHAALCGGVRYVHYGLPLADWRYRYEKKRHLVHISKIARYKGQHLAILAARRAGVELHLAGHVEDALYHAALRPLRWMSPGIKYIGEIDGTNAHLEEAAALVQTPRWFDAFPLVVLEALASATPVVAVATGGIPEQIVHGVTGFLCGPSVKELAQAMAAVDQIKPRDCRAYAEEHFSIERMAADYLTLYQRVIDGETW
jgi:glycosyltransferase involved in cell wall biosynthesis